MEIYSNGFLSFFKLIILFSSSQYISSLYKILSIYSQMSINIYMMMIFSYIPYPTPIIYYQITPNYIRVLQLLNHNFSRITVFLIIINLHSSISHQFIISPLLPLTVNLSLHSYMVLYVILDIHLSLNSHIYNLYKSENTTSSKFVA